MQGRFDSDRSGAIELGGLFHLSGPGRTPTLCGAVRKRIGDRNAERDDLPGHAQECAACWLLDERDDLEVEDLEGECPVDGCEFDAEDKAMPAWDNLDARERRHKLRRVMVDHLEGDHADDLGE